jgi:hypothetical protein
MWLHMHPGVESHEFCVFLVRAWKKEPSVWMEVEGGA